MAVKLVRRKKKRGKGRISLSTAAAERQRKVIARTKPGTGKRFSALTASLKKRGGVKSPEAVAAAIGRKKFGKKRFQKMAAAGRKRKRKT